jgi:hypothetical protein
MPLFFKQRIIHLSWAVWKISKDKYALPGLCQLTHCIPAQGFLLDLRFLFGQKALQGQPSYHSQPVNHQAEAAWAGQKKVYLKQIFLYDPALTNANDPVLKPGPARLILPATRNHNPLYQTSQHFNSNSHYPLLALVMQGRGVSF